MADTRRPRHPTRGLTEGAILAGLTVVVGAAGLVAPPIGILLAPLPIMVLVIRWGPRIAVLASVVAAAVLLQFFGPLNALSAVALFVPLGLALGWGVRREIGAQLTILAGAAAFLAASAAMLFGVAALLHQDLVAQFIKSQVDAMQLAASLQQKMGAPAQQVEVIRQTVKVLPQFLRTALPVMLGLGALIWSYLCYIVARAVLRRVGHPLPAVPPVLSWRVPPPLAAALLWISGGVSLVSLRDPRWAGASLDAMLVLVFVFGFQGALVGIAWMLRRQLPRVAIVLAGVLLFSGGLLPIAALAMLGVLDTWFDYRRLGAPPAPPAAEAEAQAKGDGPRGPASEGAGSAPRSAAPPAAGSRRGDSRKAKAIKTKAVHPQ